MVNERAMDAGLLHGIEQGVAQNGLHLSQFACVYFVPTDRIYRWVPLSRRQFANLLCSAQEMENIPEVIGVLGIPILIFFLAQIIIVFLIFGGSSSRLRRNIRSQLIGAGILGVVIVLLGFLTDAGWMLVLASGGILLMWILSHLIAWRVAVALGR